MQVRAFERYPLNVLLSPTVRFLIQKCILIKCVILVAIAVEDTVPEQKLTKSYV